MMRVLYIMTLALYQIKVMNAVNEPHCIKLKGHFHFYWERIQLTQKCQQIKAILYKLIILYLKCEPNQFIQNNYKLKGLIFLIQFTRQHDSTLKGQYINCEKLTMQ